MSKVHKKEVTEMLETLLAEHKKLPWQRNSTVLLKAMDVMNRMYAYGVDKVEVPKKFNLEAALGGAKVQTRDGRNVSGIHVVSDDRKTMYSHEPQPVQGLRATIHNSHGEGEYPFYKNGGAHLYLGDNAADLVMVE